LKAETLISLTAAKGVPLDGSRGSTPASMLEASQWFKAGRDGTDGHVRWSSNKSTRSSKAAEWTLAEAAMACGGLKDEYHWALRYSYALDDSVIWRLRAALLAFAEGRSRAERWQATVITDKGRQPYLRGLVDLVLIEDRQPSRFLKPSKAAPGRPRCMQALLLGVTTHLWRNCLEPRYELILTEYRFWLGAGAAHMRRALRDEG
jgi:hypothetical protein